MGLQYSCGYVWRPDGIGNNAKENMMIASDQARSAKQMLMYGKKKTALQSKSYKSRPHKELSSQPIKKFIKMIDFRQDDLRNIKKFMQTKEMNAPDNQK